MIKQECSGLNNDSEDGNNNVGGNNNSKHVFWAYQVPDTVLRALHVLTQLIPAITLEDKTYYHLYFTDK